MPRPAQTALRRALLRSRAPVLAAALGAALLALPAAPAGAEGLDPAARQALSAYRINARDLDAIMAITKEAKASGIPMDGGLNFTAQTVTLEKLEAQINGRPGLTGIIRKHGLDTRSFTLGELALMQGAMAGSGDAAAQTAEQILGKPNPANLRFYSSHKTKVNALLALSSSGDVTGNLSAEQQQQLDAARKMGKSLYADCVKMSILAPPVLVGFQQAAADSQSQQVASVAPGKLHTYSHNLESLAAEIYEPAPKRFLRVMAREVGQEEGHKKIALSRAFRNATADFGKWVQANCTKAVPPSGN